VYYIFITFSASSLANNCSLAIVSLVLVAETCKASVLALSSSPISPSSESSPDLRDLYRDLLSLLSLIYQSTTKLSIALNPADTIYSASVSPLGELVKHTNALTSCTTLFNNAHGKTLRTEVVDLVSNVLKSLDTLVDTFLSIARDGAQSVPKDEHLVRTGAIHSLIDKARGPNGLSANNLQAVRKKWTDDKATLDDAYGELSEMTTQAVDENDGLPDNDGWDDFALEPTKKLTTDEIQRAKKVNLSQLFFGLYFQLTPVRPRLSPSSGS
jgi:cyclin-D1-binding protein 1